MVKKIRFIWWILLLSLAIRLGLLYFQLSFNPSFSIQQDNYATYAQALRENTIRSGGLSHFDTRLFPGLPWLMYVVCSVIPISEINVGVFLSISFSLAAIYYFWQWCKNKSATILFAFFPPVWLMSSIKVATEPFVVFLSLISVSLVSKQKYFFAGLVIGYACLVRNIAIFLFAAFAVQLLRISPKTAYQAIAKISAGMVIPLVGLVIFNSIVWGHPWYQVAVYNEGLETAVGIVMLFQNIYRTIDWGQYRILVSGLTYVFLNLLGLYSLFALRKKSPLLNLSFYWALFSLLFLFSLSMQTFLEDFARYAIPIWPAIAVGLMEYAEAKWPKYLALIRKKNNTVS